MRVSFRWTSTVMLLALSACSGLPDDRFDTVGAAARVQAKVAPDALKKLRWVSGAWRGVGEKDTKQDPFYERYVFVDDTTLIVETLTDETFEQVKDRVPYILRGDSITSPTTFANTVSPDSVTFTVRDVETSQFTWRRNADSTWSAHVTSVDGSGTRDHRYYRMTRVTDKAPSKKS